MSRSNTIGAIVLGAAVGLAILKYYNMPQEEKDEFINHLKNRAHDLLDDAENTVDTVKDHFAEIDRKNPEDWTDKLFIAKKLLVNLFGSDKRYLL